MNKHNSWEECRSCKFWHWDEEDGLVIPSTMEKVGQCRRYAPQTLSGVGTGSSSKLWAETKETEWCGEFEE